MNPRKAHTFVRALVVLFSAVFFAFVVWRIILWREINNQFAQIQGAGLPVSGAELNTWRHPVPDRENGALVITQAFALLKSFPNRHDRGLPIEARDFGRTNVWPPDLQVRIIDYLRANGPAIAKTKEALEYSQFRYPVDFSYGPTTPMPHLTSLGQMGQILALQTVLDAEDDRSPKWTEDVELLLKLARTLDTEPTFISFLVRAGIVQKAVKVTQRNLTVATPSAEACLKLQNAFARAGETNLLPVALIGERALSIPVFRMSSTEAQTISETDDGDGASEATKPQRLSGKAAPLMWLSGFMERDLHFCLGTMDKSIAAASLPMPESMMSTNLLSDRSETAGKKLYILSSMLLPSLTRATVNEASMKASISLAVTSLAIERFRLDAGRLPHTLGDLVPNYLAAVPLDPFDGAKIRYRRLAKGYVIYSVGEDGKDEGGREPPGRKKLSDKSSYDITFIVEK